MGEVSRWMGKSGAKASSSERTLVDGEMSVKPLILVSPSSLVEG